jgi:hypothetical protein
MNVEHWFDALHREAQSRAYILGGRWHRHTAEAPDVHDTSAEGSHSVELAEFLDEAEAVLAEMGLP